MHGDPTVRSLLTDIMRVTFQPLLQMIIAWATEGELADPFQVRLPCCPPPPRLLSHPPPPLGRGGKGLQWRGGGDLSPQKEVGGGGGGGQPHHPPQAPTPAQYPTPRVGARPTTRALHPRTATAARKQGTRASLKGRPRGLGLGPANGWVAWVALSKRFGGYPKSAPTGGAALPG